MSCLLLFLTGCLTSNDEYLQLREALLDQDGDGHRSSDYPEMGGDDCDDDDPAVNPGVAESPYNGIDDDCDVETLDDDLDGDSFGFETDCDDEDAEINPGESEVVYNGADDDCDSSTLDDDLDADGYPYAEDCDDTDTNIHPGQYEYPYNGSDDDCDAETPDDDLDGDGYDLNSDCNDLEDDVYPGAPEIDGDDIDQDCSGEQPVLLKGRVTDEIGLMREGVEFQLTVYSAETIEDDSLWSTKFIAHDFIFFRYQTWDTSETEFEFELEVAFSDTSWTKDVSIFFIYDERYVLGCSDVFEWTNSLGVDEINVTINSADTTRENSCVTEMQ